MYPSTDTNLKFKFGVHGIRIQKPEIRASRLLIILRYGFANLESSILKLYFIVDHDLKYHMFFFVSYEDDECVTYHLNGQSAIGHILFLKYFSEKTPTKLEWNEISIGHRLISR